MFCLGILVCSQSGDHHPYQDVEKSDDHPFQDFSMANCHFHHTTKFFQNTLIWIYKVWLPIQAIMAVKQRILKPGSPTRRDFLVCDHCMWLNVT